MQSAEKKKQDKLLYDNGNEFVDGFLASNISAVDLRSRTPGVCWQKDGYISYATVVNFSQTTTYDGLPHLFRIYMNLYPPPILSACLKATEVRQKFALSDTYELATTPTLEITALPQEIGQFGRWLSRWNDAHSGGNPKPPKPPVRLISWGWNEKLESTKDDLCDVFESWHLRSYLWTEMAIEIWENWLRR